MNTDYRHQEIVSHIPQKEIVQVFPEERTTVKAVLHELTVNREMVIRFLENKLDFLKQGRLDTFSAWFYRLWIKVNYIDYLIKFDSRINKLSMLLKIYEGKKPPRGWITDDDIDMARGVPIEDLITQPLKKSGRALVGLCPFHNEKSPSFSVFPQSNRFHCFGCQETGDVISYVRQINNLSFPEAINYLIGK